MNTERSINFMAWMTVLLIIGGLATCSKANLDGIDGVSVNDLRGAAKFQAINREVQR